MIDLPRMANLLSAGQHKPNYFCYKKNKIKSVKVFFLKKGVRWYTLALSSCNMPFSFSHLLAISTFDSTWKRLLSNVRATYSSIFSVFCFVSCPSFSHSQMFDLKSKDSIRSFYLFSPIVTWTLKLFSKFRLRQYSMKKFIVTLLS